MGKQRRFRKIQPRDVLVQFLLKTPKNGRATFSITKKIIDKKAGNVTHEVVKDERLIAINKAYREEKYDFQLSHNQAQEVKDTLYAEYEKTLPVLVHNSENHKLLEDYWKNEYADRDIVEPAFSRNRLNRAIAAVGHYSLLSATKQELQEEIDSKFQGNKQRAVVAALNQLLRVAKRDIKLRKAREEVLDVKFLTVNEFLKVLKFIEDDNLKLLHAVSFATGSRLGEAFALSGQDIKENVLDVNFQIDRKNKKRRTKNRRKRKAYILKQFKPELSKWVDLAFDIKLNYRNKSIAKITKKACKQAFPDNKSKHCCFHDLRHSYAIHLVSKGVSLSLVAQALGDSIVVAEKYYSGFVLTPDSIQLIDSIMKD